MILKKDMNKMRFVFYGAFFFIFCRLNAQENYFQQEVNYKINVQLNDSIHTLKGFEEIEYINNSNTPLNFIYFHLWPNAYKYNNSALCKQMLEQGKIDLFYATPNERGYIDSLNFKVNGQQVKLIYDSIHSDVCKIILNTTLKPGDSIRISTPFFVKIPDAKFSRLGHTQQAYFITQWYPKPAVFDKNGWHPMPYLDQGEFYSEFGSFDVSITLPDNYVLAATGDRIDAEEEENFLNNRVKQTIKFIENNTRIKDGMLFPPSSKKLKTVRFKQYRVHDFAWFADKRFYALHDQIELPESKRIVDTWTFFTDKNFDLWKASIGYINEATQFYSSLLGDYPYNHVTAVDGTIMAGGGMEYPGITVIGDMNNAFDLDVTIAHEVGHNWFYAVLGNDERRFPFMDEGINSLYEMRYIRKKYPNKKLSHYLGLDSTSKGLRLNQSPIWKEKEVLYLMSHLSHNDQAIDLNSEAFSVFNYGSIIYGKTALAFNYLMDYMTESAFDEAMKNYFERFKFKHPQPEDLFNSLSSNGKMKIDWFIEHLISSTNGLDYKIKRVKGTLQNGYELLLKNKTKHAVPFNICAYKNKQLVGEMWLDGFEGKKLIQFPPAAVDNFKIDGREFLPEKNRRNNYIKTSGLFKKAKPLQFNFITALENPTKNQINFLPVFGANLYDGALIGLAIHNYGFYTKKFDYLLAPMIGSDAKQLVGFAQVDYNLFPEKKFRQITIGSKLKHFNYDVYRPKLAGINENNQLFKFLKIENYMHFIFKKKRTASTITQSIKLSNSNFFTETANNKFVLNGSTVQTYTLAKQTNYSYVNQLQYDIKNKRGIDPYSFFVNIQQAGDVSKVSLQLNYFLSINKKNYLGIRCFFGSFLSSDLNSRSTYAFRSSGYNGSDDYLFEGNYFGRNQNKSIGFSQFDEKDGALKVWTPLGRSTTWMASLNLISPRIGILPIKIYADVMICDKQFLLNDAFLWDAGVNIPVFKNMVDVYIPLFYSLDIKKTLELNNINFLNRIRFTFNIHKLVPKYFIQSYYFN